MRPRWCSPAVMVDRSLHSKQIKLSYRCFHSVIAKLYVFITLEKSELIKNSFNDIMKKLKIECLVVVEAMYSLWHTAYGQGVSPY